MSLSQPHVAPVNVTNMYRASSAKGAENAAIQGEGAVEWDTQTCVDYQQEILSSSPAPPPDQVASFDASRDFPTQRSACREGESNHQRASRDSHLDEDEADNTQSKSSQTVVKSSAEDAPVQLRRDSKDKLRPFFGRVQLQPKAGRSLAAVMEDLTQKSSMSLTQENPESVYEQFNLQRQRAAQFQSTATPDDEEEEGEDEDVTTDQNPLPSHESPNSKHHTESTGITYHEDDTGHVKLDFGTTPNDLEDDVESQDASFPAPEIGFSHGIPSYEPETPAPATNPFANKGTIMKGHELFGATQPTPSGPLFTSPNFRPSPDVYNDFSSPAKRRLLAVSPLTGPREAVETSPLQSSVRRILSRSTSELPAPVSMPGLRFSVSQSFDGTSQQQTSIEPRPYVSMKESQDRRRGTNSPLGDSDSESEPESSRRRKRERDERIQRELSTVGVSKRDPSRPGFPNSPVAATEIEVPSTGRRRSWQDDYIAQCEGLDARDTQSSQSQGLRGTQQDDVIADSQGIASRLLEAQQKSTVPDSPIMQAEIQSFQASAREQPLVREQIRNLNANVENGIPESEAGAGADPSLPLQEASLNSRITARSRSQVPRDSSAVPETSPTTQLFRPMGEVANISFSNNEDLNDIPGFTQDIEYENAMGIQSSPPQKSSVLLAPTLAAELVENLTSEFQGANVVPDDTNGLQAPAQLETIQNSDKICEQPNNKSTQPPDHNGESNSLPTITQAQVPVDEAINSHVDDNQARPKTHDTTSLDDQDAAQDLSDLPTKAAAADSPIFSPKKGASKIKKYGKARGMALDKTEAVNAQSSIRKRSSARLSSSILSTPRTTPQRESTRSSILKSNKIAEKEKSSSSVPQRRTTKRKSGAVSMITADQEIDIPTTRSSKRQSKAPNYKDDSEDPLALAGPALSNREDSHPLFKGMVFAVSYVKNENEKDNVVNLISGNGGLILEDGFDSLFESIDASHHGTKLELSTAYKSLNFAAVIADEHSRKPKYVQALALSLPSISGRWIQDCLSKQAIIDWSPYLLCAGQSSFLGNAHRSRTLQPYSATDANLQNTIESRGKLLEGQSILMITGRGKAQQKRQTFLFLARALGPVRVGQAADYAEARRKLLDGENQGQEWDLLHVDSSDKSAESAVFGSPSSSGLKKRKRGPTVAEDEQRPKRIRVINDETMIQSLIFGQLLEE